MNADGSNQRPIIEDKWEEGTPARRRSSLSTYDGIEVGRFSGPEIYDINGSYLGEV